MAFLVLAQLLSAQPSQLKSDTASVKQGSSVAQSQKDALKSDLNSMVKSGKRPDPALVDQLATDLSKSLSDGKITGLEKSKLMKDVEQVMNSAGISAAQVNQAISDAQVILTASGISKADVQKIGADLKAIAGEAPKNLSTKAQALKERFKKQYR